MPIAIMVRDSKPCLDTTALRQIRVCLGSQANTVFANQSYKPQSSRIRRINDYEFRTGTAYLNNPTFTA